MPILKRTRQVLKNRNKVDKAVRQRQKNEIIDLRTKSAYKAKLHDELKHIDILLQDSSVKAVIVKIPEKYAAQFNDAIYSEDLASYDVQQVPNSENLFEITRKIISL